MLAGGGGNMMEKVWECRSQRGKRNRLFIFASKVCAKVFADYIYIYLLPTYGMISRSYRYHIDFQVAVGLHLLAASKGRH